MENARKLWVDLLGLDIGPEELSLGHMALRALVVAVWIIVLINISHQRLVGRNSGSDVLILVILGSVLSRAINGEASFGATLGVSGFLVILHRLLMSAAFRAHWFSKLVKRDDVVLVRDGKIDWDAMGRAKITEDDLLANIRLNGKVGTVEEVREARLERSGSISVLRKSPRY